MSKKFLLSFTLILLSVSSAFSQTAAPKVTADILKNIRLDVSTSEDVIKELGKPQNDEMDELDAELIDPWIKIKKNEKVFRKLTYKNTGDADKVLFRFYENKLVKIAFDYRESKSKRVLATDLPQKYNIDFVMIQSILKDTKISDFEGQKENTIPKVYPSIYLLLSVQPDAIYLAGVNNTSFKSFLNSLKMKPSKVIFPGFLVNLEIISRSLENK